MHSILVLGSGGREHAFAWKIRQSPLCQALYTAPGNAGTDQLGENADIDILDFEAVKAFALSHSITLILVGPEEPLVKGIVDAIRADEKTSHIKVVGPTQRGALLEGSKAFAKQFMLERHIPTAAYREFEPDTLEEGIAYIASQKPPFVLKADGLAAGKGVVILDNVAEAQAELRDMLGGKFGQASSKVVIEEFLSGIEFSVFILTDGKSYQTLPVAKDYKRIGEADTGLNTGGMGAISPVPFVDDALMQKVEGRIIRPTIAGLQEMGIDYKGFIFFGLILVDGDPFVIEYNCRMGDPETEVVLPRLKNDLVVLCQSLFDGTLYKHQINKNPFVAATIVSVAGGYPGDYEKGDIITGFADVTDAQVFFAGAKSTPEGVVTNGGRVLTVTATAPTQAEAVKKANAETAKINFKGRYYRKDIGFDLV